MDAIVAMLSDAGMVEEYATRTERLLCHPPNVVPLGAMAMADEAAPGRAAGYNDGGWAVRLLPV